MSKRTNTSNQQSTQGTTSFADACDNSLLDVTFRERSHHLAGVDKTPRPATRRRARPANASAEEEALTGTLTGLDWAHSRSDAATGKRSIPRRRPVRRSNRQRWFRRILVILPLLLGLIFAGHFLLTAPYFQVQHIVIQGTSNAQMITAIQQLHLDGNNIFLADTTADAARVGALPPVARANVTRSLPDSLVVQVVERQPVLIWQVGTHQYSVDAVGALIAQVQQPGDLPIIKDEHERDLRGQPFRPGGKIDPLIVQMARQLLERLPTEANVASFSLDETLNYGLIVISADGWQARFGGPDNLENKIQELAAILHLVKQQGQPLALVDLRFGFYPYYRLKGSQTGP